MSRPERSEVLDLLRRVRASTISERLILGGQRTAGIQGGARLIAHLTEEPPPPVELPSGDRVVSWEALVRDIMGTLGWRPDLLNRLEASYPDGLAAAKN